MLVCAYSINCERISGRGTNDVVLQISYWIIEAAAQESLERANIDLESLYGDAVAIAIAGR